MQQDILFCAIGKSDAPSLAPVLEGAGAPVRLATTVEACVKAARENPPGAIVITVSGKGDRRLIADSSLADWMAEADDPMFDLLALLQALKPAISGRTISIVLLGPDLGQTGASGHTALAAAAEGQRGLMKTLARQWGPDIRFAWAGVWPPLLFPGIEAAGLPEQPELGDFNPPLGCRPGWDEVARAVLALAALGQAATGQSIIVDGGEWMLP